MKHDTKSKGNRIAVIYGETDRSIMSTYDALNRRSTHATVVPGSPDLVLTSFAFAYDKVGNLRRSVETCNQASGVAIPNRTVVTTYDCTYRLKVEAITDA